MANLYVYFEKSQDSSIEKKQITVYQNDLIPTLNTIFLQYNNFHKFTTREHIFKKIFVLEFTLNIVFTVSDVHTKKSDSDLVL